jgi:hypothetical protein
MGMSSPAGGALDVGRVLQNRYELKQRLSDGDLSIVFAALDRKTGRDVVIKSVQVGRDRSQALLLREARLQRGLASLGVVPTAIDEFVEGGSVFLVQEQVEGKSLADWQQRRSIGEVVDLYARLAKTLARLHNAGVVHRDLKPDNVIVRKSDGQPLLLDLGLAVATREHDELTSTGAVVGTPTYFAPEVIIGKPLGPPTDMYSLGVMFFEVILGKLPWKADSFGTIVESILRFDRDAVLSPLAPLAKLGLPGLIRNILDPEPAKRPAADAVSDQLGRLAATLRACQLENQPLPLDAAGIQSISSRTKDLAPIAVEAEVVDRPKTNRSRLIRLVLGALAFVVLIAYELIIKDRAGAVAGAIALIGFGSGVLIAALREQRKVSRIDRRLSDESVELKQRLSAIEKRLDEANALSASVALMIDEGISNFLRRTQMMALLELQPAGGLPVQESARIEALVKEQLRKRKPPLSKRLKLWFSVIAGAAAAAGGVAKGIQLLGLWHPGGKPRVSSIVMPMRVHRGRRVKIEVKALPAEGATMFFYEGGHGTLEPREPHEAHADWIAPQDPSLLTDTIKASVEDEHHHRAEWFPHEVMLLPPLDGAIESTADGNGSYTLTAKCAGTDDHALTYEWWVASGNAEIQPRDKPEVGLHLGQPTPTQVRIVCRISDDTDSIDVKQTIAIQPPHH